MRTPAVAFALGLLIAGCAPRLNVVPTPPSDETTSSPRVGELASAQIGEPIITMVHALSSPAIKFLDDCRFSEKFDRPGTAAVEHKVNRGTVFIQDNMSNGVPGYCGTSSQFTPPLGYVDVRHCVAASEGRLVPFPNSERIVDSTCRVTATKVTIPARGSLKRELLYDGNAGATIRLSYREYVDDMARPAFTQDASYDIRTDNVVGFKGARVRVIDANNTSIKYEVLKGF
jgi:hypothetical protein